MALNFPDSPSVNDTYTSGGVQWTWNGTAWVTGPNNAPALSVWGNASGSPAARTNLFQDDICDLIGFIGGFQMIAVQSSAPTGWTKGSSHDDKALRLVTGTASSGGSTPFLTAFASRTPAGTLSSDSISEAQLAAHAHPGSTSNAGTAGSVPGTGGVAPITAGGPANRAPFATETIASDGSGATHTHTFTGTALNFAVNYVDCIIITKN